MLIFSINITTPDYVDGTGGYAYAIAASLLVFHLSVSCLWIEVIFAARIKKNEKAKGTAIRYISASP